MPPDPHEFWGGNRQATYHRGYALFELTADPIFPEAKRYVFDRLASGAFKPILDKAFPFKEIVAAHRYMESNAQIGKIVVTV